MNIRKMIDAIVEQRVNAAIEAALGSLTETDSKGRSTDDPQFGVPMRQSRGNASSINVGDDENGNGQPRRGRKRGRGRSTVAYIVKAYRGKGRRPVPALGASWKRTWEAVKAARGPVTAIEIEKVTGDKKKTVESAVYNLRAMGLIQSQRLSE